MCDNCAFNAPLLQAAKDEATSCSASKSKLEGSLKKAAEVSPCPPFWMLFVTACWCLAAVPDRAIRLWRGTAVRAVLAARPAGRADCNTCCNLLTPCYLPRQDAAAKLKAAESSQAALKDDLAKARAELDRVSHPFRGPVAFLLCCILTPGYRTTAKTARWASKFG